MTVRESATDEVTRSDSWRENHLPMSAIFPTPRLGMRTFGKAHSEDWQSLFHTDSESRRFAHVGAGDVADDAARVEEPDDVTAAPAEAFDVLQRDVVDVDVPQRLDL